MGFIQGTPREQAILFPETIEEYISDDNPVRFIDAFVDQLDLQAAGFQLTLPPEEVSHETRSLLADHIFQGCPWFYLKPIVPQAHKSYP